MSNNFRACCVNGLSNALYQKMKQTTSNNELNSEACFRFLKDDETYNLKAQFENLFMSGTQGYYLTPMLGYLDIVLPTKLYETDIDDWSEDRTYTSCTISAGVIMSMEGLSGSPQEEVPMTFFGLFGSYAFELTLSLNYSDQTFTITDPIWYKIVLGNNTSETALPANKEVKRVNGLYNAFASSLNRVENGDIMNSDVLFDYLMNDEVYNFKNQIENSEIGSESFEMLYMAGMLSSLPVKLPAVEYDNENDTWSDQLTYASFPINIYFEDGRAVLTDLSGEAVLRIGKYFCLMDISLEPDLGSGSSYSFIPTVNSISWSKLAIDG